MCLYDLKFETKITQALKEIAPRFASFYEAFEITHKLPQLIENG